jgi:hypothetical protein
MINYGCMVDCHNTLLQPAGLTAVLATRPQPRAPKVLIATKLSEFPLTTRKINNFQFPNRDKTTISQISFCGGLSGTAALGCLLFPVSGQSIGRWRAIRSEVFSRAYFRRDISLGAGSGKALVAVATNRHNSELETPVTHRKHTMDTRSNRHKNTPLPFFYGCPRRTAAHRVPVHPSHPQPPLSPAVRLTSLPPHKIDTPRPPRLACSQRFSHQGQPRPCGPAHRD